MPTVSLEHHTWQLHVACISFLKSLQSSLEESATRHWRESQPSNPKRNDDGDYIQSRWIYPTAQGKRKRCKSTAKMNDSTITRDDRYLLREQYRHLLLDVFVQEEWSATVALCFANETENNDYITFDMCIARGRKSSYETIFQWIRSLNSNSCYISLHPLSFTSSDLKWLVERWAVQVEDFATKPWTITFETPPQIQKLDTISLKIPSESLRNMLVHISSSKNSTMPDEVEANPDSATATKLNDSQTTLANSKSKKDFGIIIQKNIYAQHDDADRANNGRTLLEVHHHLPVVEAVKHFILESFGINVSSFNIVKVSTALVTISGDGRFKVTRYGVLESIRDIAVLHREQITRSY